MAIGQPTCRQRGRIMVNSTRKIFKEKFEKLELEGL